MEQFSYRLTLTALSDSTLLSARKKGGPHGRKRRSATSTLDIITVDESVGELIVCTDSEHSMSTITLTDPGDNTIAPDMSFDKGAVYIVPGSHSQENGN